MVPIPVHRQQEDVSWMGARESQIEPNRARKRVRWALFLALSGLLYSSCFFSCFDLIWGKSRLTVLSAFTKNKNVQNSELEIVDITGVLLMSIPYMTIPSQN